ncbi:hypothetical protein [Leifsonia aquatica]|uniref:hypothetical protein n=2 Tax=Leifsonia aquatica TaxID=144185 RepID=UPI0038167EDC
MLAVCLTLGVSMATPALGDPGDPGDGSLDLNADILVDESVGTGSVGDFAVRGRLFSVDLSARADEQREASAARLDVADSLTFEPPDAGAESYEAVRAGLFADYTSDMHSQTVESREESPVLHLLVLVAGVPLVVLIGVFLGRVWARRRRVSA